MITQFYGNADDANRAAAELTQYGFDEADVHVVTLSGTGSTDGALAALKQAGLRGGEASRCAARVEAGETLVAVNAVFGTGALASQILGDHNPADSGHVGSFGSSHSGTEIHDPAPLSHALGLRLLSNDPAPLSRLFGLSLLSNKQPSPKLSNDPAPLSHAVGMPVLSGRAAPVSAALHMPTLSSNAAPLSSVAGMGVLSSDPAPLSKSLGWKTLSEEPAPLSKLLGLPVLVRQDR